MLEKLSTARSLWVGFSSSADYFVSTFLFGVMFGVTASAVGLSQFNAMLMSGFSFSASAQFAALEFWYSPLPYGTIALSVALVSSRNLLLGMSMTHHFDGHSLGRRIVSLFLLNDPGVVTSARQGPEVDRLGYVTGYGISMMVSWLLSVSIGLNIVNLVGDFDLSSMSFAGSLVIATMMILFAKNGNSKPTPWIISGIVSLLLVELGVANYLILLLSVSIGVAVAIVQERKTNG